MEAPCSQRNCKFAPAKEESWVQVQGSCRACYLNVVMNDIPIRGQPFDMKH